MQELTFGLAQRYFAESRAVLDACARDIDFLGLVRQIAERITRAIEQGNKVLVCGNGGSAADAQHFAAELVGRFDRDRAPLAAIALGGDALLTAIANDFGFEHVFARQVAALGRPGDVLVGLSTSGQSRNVLNALTAARGLGLVTIGLTGGAFGEMDETSDLLLRVPSSQPPIVQQVHMTACHAICALIERHLGIGD